MNQNWWGFKKKILFFSPSDLFPVHIRPIKYNCYLNIYLSNPPIFSFLIIFICILFCCCYLISVSGCTQYSFSVLSLPNAPWAHSHVAIYNGQRYIKGTNKQAPDAPFSLHGLFVLFSLLNTYEYVLHKLFVWGHTTMLMLRVKPIWPNIIRNSLYIVWMIMTICQTIAF